MWFFFRLELVGNLFHGSLFAQVKVTDMFSFQRRIFVEWTATVQVTRPNSSGTRMVVNNPVGQKNKTYQRTEKISVSQRPANYMLVSR